jgi:hypothetical protein
MTPSDPFAVGRPAKIQGQHLERLAVIYVRQSHPHQVLKHPESAQVQANLRQRALAWGWPAERILVLDGDQGRTATTTFGRDDFGWLLGEIALDHVGLVFGFQINRLAREDEACCRLIKVCAAFDTLLADEDGLYLPQDFNDRLVLTIKGFMGAYPSPAASSLLASRASVPLFMVYVRRSALSRALHTGTQVLFCAPTTLSA